MPHAALDQRDRAGAVGSVEDTRAALGLIEQRQDGQAGLDATQGGAFDPQVKRGTRRAFAFDFPQPVISERRLRRVCRAPGELVPR